MKPTSTPEGGDTVLAIEAAKQRESDVPIEPEAALIGRGERNSGVSLNQPARPVTEDHSAAMKIAPV
jgi:hypothetical protein